MDWGGRQTNETRAVDSQSLEALRVCTPIASNCHINTLNAGSLTVHTLPCYRSDLGYSEKFVDMYSLLLNNKFQNFSAQNMNGNVVLQQAYTH